MTELEKGKSVTLEELLVSALAQGDALAKLLINKGVIRMTLNLTNPQPHRVRLT